MVKCLEPSFQEWGGGWGGEECAEGLLEAFCGLYVFQEWEECSWVG